MVPFAIDEAERLYNRHMYVSVSLAQMWKTREDCMKAESGLDRIPGGDGARSSTFNQDVRATTFLGMLSHSPYRKPRAANPCPTSHLLTR